MGLFSRGRAFFKKKQTFYANELIFDFLKNAGSPELNVNGSITPVEFSYVVPAGKAAWVERINFAAHNAAILPDTFIGLAALANGLDIKAYDDEDNLLINFFDGESIKKQVDFSSLAGIDAVVDAKASGEDGFAARWTISKAGEPLFMREGHKIKLVVNDDLTTIGQFRAMIQGMIVDKF